MIAGRIVPPACGYWLMKHLRCGVDADDFYLSFQHFFWKKRNFYYAYITIFISQEMGWIQFIKYFRSVSEDCE